MSKAATATLNGVDRVRQRIWNAERSTCGTRSDYGHELDETMMLAEPAGALVGAERGPATCGPSQLAKLGSWLVLLVKPGPGAADVLLTRAIGSFRPIETTRSAQWIARNRLRSRPRPVNFGTGSSSRRSLAAPLAVGKASMSGTGSCRMIRFATGAK